MPLSSILDGNEKSLHSKALLPMSLHKTTATTAAATTTTAAAQHRSCFYLESDFIFNLLCLIF